MEFELRIWRFFLYISTTYRRPKPEAVEDDPRPVAIGFTQPG